MIKKGYFGIYNNQEYKITREAEDNLFVMTKDMEKVSQGFVDEYKSGVYTKQINKKDLEAYYYIKPIAVYKGFEFNVMANEKNGKVYLGTQNADLAKKMNFNRTDKYYFEKWISRNEVEITEKYKNLPLE